MKPGEQLIYISDFGYELCTFIEEGKRGQLIVHIVSGAFHGHQFSLPEIEIKPYSKELVKKLQKQFTSGPEWSDVF